MFRHPWLLLLSVDHLPKHSTEMVKWFSILHRPINWSLCSNHRARGGLATTGPFAEHLLRANLVGRRFASQRLSLSPSPIWSSKDAIEWFSQLLSSFPHLYRTPYSLTELLIPYPHIITSFISSLSRHGSRGRSGVKPDFSSPGHWAVLLAADVILAPHYTIT